MEILLLPIAYLVLAISVGLIASKRGRGFWDWFALSLVFPGVTMLIVACFADLKAEAAKREAASAKEQEALAKIVAVAAPLASTSYSAADDLNKLSALVDKGHLTAEEFAAHKSIILARAA